MDRVASFMAERTPRRLLALGSFVALLWLFRHLALLLVFFVAFERSLRWAAGTLAARTRLSHKKSVLAVVVAAVVGLGVGVYLGIGRAVRTVRMLERELPDWIAELRENPLVGKLEEHIGGTESAVDTAKHYAGDALAAASAVGHFFIHMVVGAILAIVFVLEDEELRAFWSRVEGRSILGTLGRWLGYVADATVVTVKLQLIVAVFNTVTTLPVLLVLGVRHVAVLMVLVFVSALVPVIGNVVSGTILALLAYQAKGWLGVGIFASLTFVLHKIESYYLSPRLTSRHVAIPGFLLIVSLLACEQLFGFTGFFLSFPILFVAGHIRTEWIEEDVGPAGSPIDLLP